MSPRQMSRAFVVLCALAVAAIAYATLTAGTGHARPVCKPPARAVAELDLSRPVVKANTERWLRKVTDQPEHADLQISVSSFKPGLLKLAMLVQIVEGQRYVREVTLEQHCAGGAWTITAATYGYASGPPIPLPMLP